VRWVNRMSAGINVDRIKASLRKEEGLILHVYKCPAGKRTIGYGHNIDAKGLPKYIDFYLSQHGEITLEMAEFLLDVDLMQATSDTVKLFSQTAWEWLTQIRREVLINMTFNMGSLKTWHHLIASVEAQDVVGCVQSMTDSKWHEQLPERSGRLIKDFQEAIA
jgi:lysozyme